MPEQIRVLLVDDEIGSIKSLTSIIEHTAPELNIIGQAQSVDDAYQLINELKPDLVFLDIQLRDQTGFDLLDKHFEFDFEVVFITAYDQYAVRAFEQNALSYLLKPISISDFDRVKERILKLIASKDEKSPKNIKTILEGRLAIPNATSIEYVETDRILYLKADGSYSEIYLLDGRKIIVSKSLTQMEQKLNDQIFFRPHRSYSVNKNFVTRWNKVNGGSLIMENSHEIPISRAGRQVVDANMT